jgi:hypothetical protein
MTAVGRGTTHRAVRCTETRHLPAGVTGGDYEGLRLCGSLTANVVPSSLIHFTLMMEAICSSEA